VFFAHSYGWTGWPVIVGCALAAVLARPSILQRSAVSLDAAIVLALAGIAAQLIPLAPAARERVTPAAVALERQLFVEAPDAPRPSAPLSVDPPATAMAVALCTAMALAFWSARTALHRGGIRHLARALGTIALVVTPLAVVHHLNLLAGLDILWPSTRRDLRPWGPFVNRNDFAGWLLLVLGVTLGYLVTRLQATHRASEPLDPDRAFDERGTRIFAAVGVTAGGIMLSLSRSGLLGLAVALATFVVAGHRRLESGRLRRLTLALAAVVVGAVVFANLGALSARVGAAASEGLAGRLSVWRQTWPIVRDFWPVGTGIGGYSRAMSAYQTSIRLITIAHADNEALQILAEGGALVGVPAALVVIFTIGLIGRRLREDRTPIFWIRAGAASGLLGIAAQNMVEMTLRTPATGLLVAVVAAVAAHEPLRVR